MKHVSYVNNISNLHAFIRQELRELGIKVPKPKKSKRAAQNQKNQETNKASIFGNYLAQVHCVHVPCCGYVAKFLVDAAEIITDNIDNEGVFRKSGAVSRQKEIKQQLENGNGFDKANVHDVTALVKQFFRELPEPLFTSMYHDTFIRCYQIEDPEVATRAILLLCLLLPSEHLSTLRFTMKLLSRVTEYVESNKMDSANLAVVLAPNIMHVNSKSETMKSCEEKMLQVQTSVVELLIKHADQVGMVDDNMVEKTALMSEVFSTDDELDASDDNMLEDSRETRKKDKKRKRSGSFQGIFSGIAQSITKWRRSTDGKTNTSGISQGSQCSNNSHMSAQGNTKQPEDGSYNNQVYQFSGADATPVVRRMKTVTGTEGRAFSASKKKAILNGLPQHSALANTPYTPAAGMRKLDIQSARRGLHDTPSWPPRPHQTPRQSMKTPRKKLALFSPASTTKKKRYSSSSNLPVNSGSKKSGKSKGIFRRLSGSKGDQAFPTDKSSSQEQIGQRLAVSPTSTRSSASVQSNSSHLSEVSKIISDESPIAAIAQNSFSSSVCEQSVVSTYDDMSRSLNEGFIVTEDKEGDITRIMSEPAIAGSFEAGEYVCLDEFRPRASESDTTLLSSRSEETPKGLCRSFSVDSTLDGSTKKSSLSRGRPNSIKVGLLQGDQSEVQKLRRSFGLEKSDISFPLPLSVSSMSDEDQYVQLDGSFDFLKPDSHTNCDQNPDDNQDENGADSPGSVSRCYPSVSESSLHSNDTNQHDDECNVKPANGFSAISGETVFKMPKKSEDNDDQLKLKIYTEVDGKKSLAQQKQESKDSLLSEASSTISPVMLFKEREMTRSISADSGKGSMCDGDVMLDSSSHSEVETKDSPFVTNCEEETTTTSSLLETRTEDESVDITKEKEMESMNDDPEKTSLAHKKSVSTQDLQRDIETSTRVSRSKSLLESSISRRCNARPNLQISAETHKLLARAGYIREQMTDPNPGFGDFVVPTSFPFIEEPPETWNPRRESIIALQKNNAGKVKSNVMQFDKITEAELDKKHSSPFRFPNSTTRKRGTTRLRIPSVFNDSETDIDQTMTSSGLFDTSKDRIMKGTAMLPISTQMIKPSDPDMKNQEDSSSVNVGLKRKPSIYRAYKDDVMPPANKERRLNKRLTYTEELDETSNGNTNNLNVSDKLEDSVFAVSGTLDIFQGRSLDLDQSLQDTINNVCTPNSEIFVQNLHKSDKENSCTDDGNVKKMPEIKPSILTPPTLEHMTYRTATNKTPVDLFRAVVSPRSPIKPLKRLGASPHSPRNKPVRSPKLVLAKRRSLLTALPNPNDDFDNL